MIFLILLSPQSETAHIGRYPFLHQIVVLTFPNGNKFVLDPWRDKKNPMVDYDEYNKKHGPINSGF